MGVEVLKVSGAKAAGVKPVFESIGSAKRSAPRRRLASGFSCGVKGPPFNQRELE